MWYNVDMGTSDGITLAAVIVALGIGVTSIIQTKRIQKRTYKHALLKEIIDWATDVGSPKYGLNIDVLTSGGISDNDKLLASLLTQAFHLDMLIQKSNYIAKIAPIFTKDLEKAVEEVRVALREHQKIIDSFTDGKIDAKTVGKHDFVLTETANNGLPPKKESSFSVRLENKKGGNRWSGNLTHRSRLSTSCAKLKSC